MFTFTNENPQFKITRQVPFDLSFVLTPPAGWEPEWPLRLLHCRTGDGRPRDTEVFELKASARGRLVVELSGFGGKQPQFREPLKAELPADGRYHVSYVTGAVQVNGMTGDTHLDPPAGTEVELLFGFDKPNEGVLEAPIGWVLTGIPEADENPVAVQPPAPPAPPVTPPAPEPPTPPVVPPAPSPVAPPPSPTPGASLEDELVADLRLLAVKYIGRAGLPPDLALVAQMLMSGGPVDLRRILLTVLVSRL